MKSMHYFKAILLIAVALSASPESVLGFSDTIVLYGITPSGTARSRTWDGSNWSSETNSVSPLANHLWMVAKGSPTTVEHMSMVADDASQLTAMRFNGSSWGNQITLTTNVGTTTYRPFDVAYEKVSGKAIVAYRNADEKYVHYRVWNGSSWSSAATTTIISEKPNWIKMASSPLTNEIVLAVLDNSKDVHVSVWNGTSFSTMFQIESNVSDQRYENIDVAYEQLSGRCVVVWMPSGSSHPSYRIWNGTSWSSEASITGASHPSRYLHLASDPTTNRLALMDLDQNKKLNMNIWSGTAWGNYLQPATDAPSADSRCVDIEFEPGGSRVLAAYARNGNNNVLYRTFNGTSWSSEMTGPNVGEVPSVIQLKKGSSSTDILLACEKSGNRSLQIMKWDGSTLSGTTQVSAELHTGTSGYETFMISRRKSDAVRVVRWREVPNPDPLNP